MSSSSTKDYDGSYGTSDEFDYSSDNMHRSPATDSHSTERDTKPTRIFRPPDVLKVGGRVSPLRVFRYANWFDWVTTVFGGICAFASGGSSPLFMYTFGQMTTYAYGGDLQTIGKVTRNFALLMTCIGALVFVLSLVASAAFLVSAARQTGRIKCAYFAAVLSQDIGWHDEHKPGELISRLTGDTRVFQLGVNDRLASGLQSLGTGVFGFIFAFIACWELSLLFLSAMPIVVIVTLVLSFIASRYVSVTRAEYAKAASISTEVMENIKTVQTFNKESFEAERFASTVLNSRSAGIKKEFMVSMASGSGMAIVFCVFGCSFIFASYLVEWGRADVGTVSSSFLSVLYGASGFGQVLPAMMSFNESCTTAYPLFKVIDREPEIDIDKEGVDCSFNKVIEFRNVDFEYPTRLDQPIFRGLNVTIRKGEKIAFSGSTGSGKSTIIALIQRFYDPTGGSVLVDGTDMRDLTLHKWRENIGIVSQEPNLFSGTVIENVQVGRQDATFAEVVRACKRARIHDTIMSLPNKYETSIGAVGGQLSGGQKQRLAIARAIVRNARILLLDEATSALDRKSEIEVQRAIDDLTTDGGMTVITIAHRLATIKNMDRIYYIDNMGEGSYIAEYGTYDELINMNGRFASMAMMQNQSLGESLSIAAGSGLGSWTGTSSKESTSVAPTGTLSMYELGDDDEGDAYRKYSGSNGDVDTDNWSELSNELDVPFEFRTEWEKKHTHVNMCRLMSLTRSKTWAILLGFGGSILTAIVTPVCSLLISQVIVVLGECAQTGDTKHMHSRMFIFAPLLIVLGVVAFLGMTLTGFYGYVGEHLTYYLRVTLFEQILRQDQTFFDLPHRDAGSLGGILSGDCEAVHQLYGPTLGSRLRTVFAMVGGLLIGFLFQWKVALVSLSTMPLLVGGAVAQQIFFGNTEKKPTTTLDMIVSESLSSIRTINSFNLKDVMSLRFNRIINKETTLSDRRNALISFVVGGTSFVTMGSVALAFWYGGTLIEKGETQFGNVLVASMSIMMGSSFAGAEAGSFATKMRDSRKSARNVFSIIDRVPDVDAYEYGDTEMGDGCNIVFHQVGFRYPARQQAEVLKGVNLAFKSRTSNGLIGQTGCGKSTIVQLLARFYLPSRGEVVVNGKDITSLDTVTWRDSISIVLQEPALFSGTIRENIKYSLDSATDEEMYEAAKIACIHEEILEMDDGYDTQVGYRGRELSGGQKQRVAIARGVLRCPKLLLLDEATSALDNVTEAAVQMNMDAYQRQFGVTIVSIAHRLSTIQNSDQIVVLDNGRIIEHGNHEELIALNGEYKARWEMLQH